MGPVHDQCRVPQYMNYHNMVGNNCTKVVTLRFVLQYILNQFFIFRLNKDCIRCWCTCKYNLNLYYAQYLTEVSTIQLQYYWISLGASNHDNLKV